MTIVSVQSRTANNEIPNLVPRKGAWRGATLGSQFEGEGGDGGVKIDRFEEEYGETPLQLYRQFNCTPSMNSISPETRAWVKKGGILWYNIRYPSWKDGAEGSYDEYAKAWAAAVSSLAPANVFVTVYHEPDHNVCFVSPCRQKKNVPGNTPANYRAMYARIQDIFISENVSNAVWVVDFSAKISSNATLANAASGCYDDQHCTAVGAIASLWPGNDRVDWVRCVHDPYPSSSSRIRRGSHASSLSKHTHTHTYTQLFFNAFESDNKDLEPKATFDDIVGSSYKLLEAMPTDVDVMKHCASGDCNFTALPWGVGAFASHGQAQWGNPPPTPAQRIQWFHDAQESLSTRPRLRAYIYFDSLDSEVLFNGTDPSVDDAFRSYLASPQFSVNDPASSSL